MKNTRKILAGILVLLMAAAFAGCTGTEAPSTSGVTQTSAAVSSSTPSTAPASTVNAEPIRIGVMSALTGDRAAFGIPEADGAEMAVKDINAAGGIMGRKVELYRGDTRGTVEDGVNALRQLMDQNNVDIIVGPSTSGIVIACAPIVNEAKLPMIGSTCTNPKCTVVDGVVNPYVWRYAYTDPYQGTIVASFAIEKLGLKTAAILYDVGSDYAIGLSEAFVEAFQSRGGTIVAKEAYNTGDVDYRSQLTTIKKQNPDIIFLPNQYQEIAMAAKQMADLGIKAQILCGDSGAHKPIIEVAGAAYDGAYYVTFFSNADPVVVNFIQRYMTEYKLDTAPSSNNVIAYYDLIYWVKDAIERAGTTDGEKLAEAITATKDLELQTGTITMDDATHNPLNREGVLMHVENGKQVFVSKYRPN